MTLASRNRAAEIALIIQAHGTERRHLIDIVRETQRKYGCVSGDAMEAIASEMDIHRVEVEGVVSFYHFLTKKQLPTITIYLTRGAVPSINGALETAAAFEKELGIKIGESTVDDPVGLEWTSCIGMNDQEPAVLINGVVITNVTADKVPGIVSHLKNGNAPEDLVTVTGDGNNSSEHVHAMVNNNIRRAEEVLFGERKTGDAIRKLVTMSGEEVLGEVKKSNLKGRGGAGFPTGLKWDFCLKNNTETRYIVCNADEGEPGTFKDRVILTELPYLLFEGMTVGARVLGAKEGILYLRSEYEYLRKHLEDVLNKMRNDNLLGNNIAGIEGFNFDIRIQMGAGAYICGEETALIESAEGKRGEPRDRPPFPVSRGYLDDPTAVNNVETLCCAARIIEKGAEWFTSFGTEKSAGTKLLSISGDVDKPGVYEFPFGTKLTDILAEAGGSDAMAVTVGGPSGKIVSSKDFGRMIAFEDLATGGSMIVIGQNRDLLRIVHDYMEFFIEESCGRCTPCRVGNPLMLNRLIKIMEGRGTLSDLEYMKSLGKVVTNMSRCGLGLTSTNPVTTSMESFPELYGDLLTDKEFTPEHDMERAIEIGREAANFK